MIRFSPFLHARLLEVAPSENALLVESLPFFNGQSAQNVKPANSVFTVRLSNGFESNTGFLAEVLSNAGPGLRKTSVSLNMTGFVQNGDEIELDRQHGSLLVVEPGWLVNVTALTELDYCQRRFHVKRFMSQSPSEPMLRGSLIHNVFESVLKAPEKHDALRRRLQDAFSDVVTSFALMDICPVKTEETVRAHLNRLYRFRRKHLDSAINIQSERYMINPFFGLKGKIDAVLKYEDNSIRALELKTGRCWGGKVQKGHAFQAQAYSLMLSWRYRGKKILNPLVLYSGDEELREGVAKQVSYAYNDAFHVMRLRNSLVFADLCATTVQSLSDGRCVSCRQKQDCSMLNGLFGHSDRKHADSHTNLVFFERFYRQLLTEYDAIRREQIKNLTTPISDRIQDGRAVRIKAYNLEAEVLNLHLEHPNCSEIREGDACLLSCEKGTIAGDCAEAVVESVTEKSIRVRTSASVQTGAFKPAFLELHVKEAMFEKNFASFAHLFKDQELAIYLELLNGITENLAPNAVSLWEADETADAVSAMQKRAVSLSLGLQKLLLIQGPPGTGKTTTIARIIKAQQSAGKRCLVACYTHRAVDEVSKKLSRICPDISVYRLNSERCFQEPLPAQELKDSSRFGHLMLRQIERIRQGLADMEVFVGTTHAWLSGNYDNLLSGGLFDVALIDEASQIFAPHLLGILSLAQAHILVGDHRQLPPVVLSETTPDLKKSLFESLFELDYGNKNIKVMLDEQFRMPEAICDFISKEFYEGMLHTSPYKKQGQKRTSCCIEVDQLTDILLSDVQIVLICHNEKNIEKQSVRTNQLEADLIANIVTRLLKIHGISEDSDHERLEGLLGVIAPYRAQVAAIRTALGRDTTIAQDVIRAMVDTVERFQGDERMEIIFSLTGADWEACQSHSADNPAANRFLDDPRRLNVALSRARQRFIGVGDWRQASKHSRLIGRLVEFVQSDQRCLFVEGDGICH